MEDRTNFFAGLILIIFVIGMVVWYQIFFAQNCLKSHTEYYTSYTSQCMHYSKKGTCTSTILMPEVNSDQVCDVWKQ
jgi:hypothetical protein